VLRRPGAFVAHELLGTPGRVGGHELVDGGVVDVGGNIGLFALDALRRYPGAIVTSVEPDPTNLPVLNACRARNGSADWTIIPAAAGPEAGAVRFDAGHFADSAISADGTVEVPMIDLFPLLDGADLVKIDIEGGEWPILLDARFRDVRAPVVVLEWHAAQAPADRETRGVVLEIFAAAGYRALAEGDNHHGVIWGWR